MEFVRVAVWLLAYAVLAGAGLPIAARLFPWLAGRGAGFALPVALVVLTTGAYWVGQVSYAVAPFVGLALLGAVSIAALLDWRTLRESGPAALRDGPPLTFESDPRAIREVAVVFALAFLLLVAIRAVDPAVHPIGGEKFLDFGLLKSLDRAESLPPQDVWFANEPVQYYYGGHLIASLLARLTGTPPRFAYNLALAGFYASLVAAAFDLAGAIGVDRGVPRRVAGAFAVFFVGLASNLFTAVRLLLQSLPAGLQRSAASVGAALSPQTTVDAILDTHETFSYWNASRVISRTINEFPFFAWLNGDLHAHMMGTPFLLLAAALSYNYFRAPTGRRWERRLAVFVAVPVVAGLQAVIDTWSFPSLFGLLWLAVALGPADPLTLFPRRVAAGVRRRLGVTESDLVGREHKSLRAEAIRPAAALVAVGVGGTVAVALAAPFLLGAAGGREIAVLAADARSGFGGLVLVHGVFLAAFAAYLLTRLRAEHPEDLLVALVVLGTVAFGIDAPILLLTVPLLVGGWVALRFERDAGFETLLIVAGAGLVTIVEFLYVKEQAGPLRMNTVFKTYTQVWVLWGTAAGVAVPGLLTPAARDATPGDAATTSADGGSVEDRTRRLANAAGRATGEWPELSGVGGTLRALFVAGLVLSTALYAPLALAEHYGGADDPATLDATAFVERDHPAYAGGIDYVDELEGQPTLLSAPATSQCLDLETGYPCEPGMYGWHSSPAASLTGVPTVVGWAHEVGYRGEEAYVSRARDADAIYRGSPETRARLLLKYDVEYVWVGGAERARYGQVSFANTPGVVRAYEAGAVTVYRVDREQLAASTT